MSAIISIFYLILFLSIAIIGLYVCYHIFRYSLSKGGAFVTVFIFASVFLFFLMTNAYLFFRVDWVSIFSSPGIQPQFTSTYSRF
jgi:multisubunit Na+/H+ antiporter MnhB subunit